MKNKDIKKIVKEKYAKIAVTGSSCCSSSSCGCGPDPAEMMSKKIGYNDSELKTIPDGANLGLGCGNPTALASLKEGETVLDLGSGAGLDCFLAAKRVGDNGTVIGVDMTPEMVEKAKKNAERGNYKNVEFKLGEIENLPVDDNSVDVIISNCVINLSPDKRKAFQEAFRVLKNGGRLMVSDLVLEKELPKEIKESIEAYVGCISGALLKSEYLKCIKEAGFDQVKIINETAYPAEGMVGEKIAKTVVSIKVSAIKTLR